MKKKLLHVQVSSLPPELYPREEELKAAKRQKVAEYKHRIALLLERIAKLERQQNKKNRQRTCDRAAEIVAVRFGRMTGTVPATEIRTNRRTNRRG